LESALRERPPPRQLACFYSAAVAWNSTAVDKPRIQIKRIPRADGVGYDAHQIVLNSLSKWTLFETITGMAKVKLGGQERMDPLFELGPLEVLGAEKIRAEFELAYGRVFKDLGRFD
jgi:acetoacetate decarboxylase